VSNEQSTEILTLRCVGCGQVPYAAVMGRDPEWDAEHYMEAAKSMKRNPGKYVQELKSADEPVTLGQCICSQKPKQGSLL
jgi:hypothetical protein